MLRIGLRIKLFIITSITTLGLMVMIGSAAYGEYQLLLDGRKKEVHHIIQTTTSLIREKISVNGNNEHTRTELLTILNKIRYGDSTNGNNYVWVQNPSGVMLMHPFHPNLNGKNMLDMHDAENKPFMVEIVEVAKASKEGGYVRYHWPYPGRMDPVEKISYVQHIPELNWIIGTGVYIADVKDAFFKSLVSLCILGIIILLCLVIPLHYISKSILVSLGGEPDEAYAITERITNGDLTGNINPNSSGLIGHLYEMQERLKIIVSSAVYDTQIVRGAAFQLHEDAVSTHIRTAVQDISSKEMLDSAKHMIDEISNISNNNKSVAEVSDKSIGLIGNELEVINSIAASYAHAEITNNIGRVVEQLNIINNAVSEISNNLTKQDDISLELSKKIEEIVVVSMDNLLKLDKNKDFSNELTVMANRLVATMQFFKVADNDKLNESDEDDF